MCDGLEVEYRTGSRATGFNISHSNVMSDLK